MDINDGCIIFKSQNNDGIPFWVMGTSLAFLDHCNI